MSRKVKSSSASPARHISLPPSSASFIGRRADLDTLGRLFAGGERFVTLLGPAGIGKTRLATHFARNLGDYGGQADGGVWFCDLTEARDINDICAVVGRVLEVPM